MTAHNQAMATSAGFTCTTFGTADKFAAVAVGAAVAPLSLAIVPYRFYAMGGSRIRGLVDLVDGFSCTQKPRGLFAILHRSAWLVVYEIAIARAKPKLAPYLAPFTRTAADPVVPGSFAFRVWAEANPKRCWAVVLREA